MPSFTRYSIAPYMILISLTMRLSQASSISYEARCICKVPNPGCTRGSLAIKANYCIVKNGVLSFPVQAVGSQACQLQPRSVQVARICTTLPVSQGFLQSKFCFQGRAGHARASTIAGTVRPRKGTGEQAINLCLLRIGQQDPGLAFVC
ncbi:hypothetical protein VFPPC_15405 [Pochonia chlamydosporia 170]|uniref:Secreted protein n=1 Tax=Pochonia chlamydosporia 170 TaxID=1380566 RepID=A0A179G8C3_METCM|nr:hypothetical protein VFPPC_15405 [Pochonia chlamydosporia 170]OAQ74054.1 hypothetical protein VFPPC_15405 [Pochonia chlamydosporia 170]